MSHSKLTPTQYKCIIHLLSEPTIKGAAEAAGVTPKSLYRWLDDETFNTEYTKARRRAVQAATSRLQQLSSDAVTELHNIIKDTKISAGVRVAAIRLALEMAIKGTELDDLAARVASLEGGSHAQ